MKTRLFVAREFVNLRESEPELSGSVNLTEALPIA